MDINRVSTISDRQRHAAHQAQDENRAFTLLNAQMDTRLRSKIKTNNALVAKYFGGTEDKMKQTVGRQVEKLATSAQGESILPVPW